MDWNGKPYHSFDYMLKTSFGEKIYKVALDAGMTCPNRDGTLDNRGCIFCSQGGSGDFAASRKLSITEQINVQAAAIAEKRGVHKFIAYFQAYTNTYAPLPYLKEVFTEALDHPLVAAVSIGTRPDCLSAPVVTLLDELQAKKPIWVELGLQTIHEDTAHYIRRGYELPVFEDALMRLSERSIPIIVHTILGLPNEGIPKVLQTIDYLNTKKIQGIKLQLLHVLKDTDLAADYLAGKFQVLTMEEYLDMVTACLEHLSQDIVIHRLTGDGPKELLTAPLWSSRKRTVLNTLHQHLKERNTWQGRLQERR